MLRFAGPATVFLFSLALAVQAQACKGSKILFSEDFVEPDATWGTTIPAERLQIKGGSATVSAEPGRGQSVLNTGFVFDDADVCATVTAVRTPDPTDSAGGVMFWAKDYGNFYAFLVASNGHYRVSRQIGSAWAQPPIPWTKSDAISQGPNAANRLRITLKGQTVTLYINDKQVARLRAQSPGIPSHIGIYGESATKSGQPDIWQFADFKVTNVD